jgi:hypothetical protein
VNGACEEISSTNSSSQCVCDNGYVGPSCDTPDCSLLGNCNGQGVCVAPEQCVCNKGFSGTRCDIPVSTSTSLVPIIAGSVGGAVFVICMLVIILLIVIKSRQQPPVTPKTEEEMKLQRASSEANLRELLGNWEIDFRELSFQDKLGAGAFGIVYHAKWRKADCAVKQLLVDGKNEKALKEFLKEALNMKRIRPHPNVVGMLGVAVNPEYPLCIVTEYLPQGSLDNLLSNSSVTITPGQALFMAADVASGMSHLHKESIIHCDLAARNLLCVQIKDKIAVKVADFGLSKISESGIYDATSDHKFPVKWSAPEVILHGKFSKASDMWSYGVVLYEIFERRLPYAGMSNKEVIEEVCDKGHRLAKPTIITMPDELYDLMKLMWDTEPEKRPVFEKIHDDLKAIARKYGYQEEVPDDQNYAHGKKGLGLQDEGGDQYNSISFKDNPEEGYKSGNTLGLRE